MFSRAREEKNMEHDWYYLMHRRPPTPLSPSSDALHFRNVYHSLSLSHSLTHSLFLCNRGSDDVSRTILLFHKHASRISKSSLPPLCWIQYNIIYRSTNICEPTRRRIKCRRATRTNHIAIIKAFFEWSVRQWRIKVHGVVVPSIFFSQKYYMFMQFQTSVLILHIYYIFFL